MIKNFLVVAWRNLRLHRVNSTINIVGLAIGMGVAMLIGLWVWDEVRFDTYDPHYKRVAAVYQNMTINGEVGTGQAIPIPLGEELRKNYGSHFKRVALSSWSQDAAAAVGDKKLMTTGNWIEPDGPEILGITMVEGSTDGIRDPSSILISQWLATALFGKTDPLNRVIKLNDTTNFTVTGVYQDPVPNSMLGEIQVDFFAPWAVYLRGINEHRRSSWNSNFNQCFVELADGENMQAVSRAIRDVKLRRAKPEVAASKPAMFLHPMSKWHLYSEFENGKPAGGRIQYVWLFGVIGMFVLILACINFMNLSTARSEKRAKEVGIRKAVGSLRGQLVGQFYTESLLYAFLAFLLALLAVQLVLASFNTLAGKQIVMLWDNPGFWVAGVAFTVLTGFIAGSYPALYLSSFRPVKVLKGVFKAGRFAAMPRRVLVVLQFAVSVVLIIGTIVVFRQIEYAKDRPVGYSQKGLVNAYLPTRALHDHFDAFRADLLKSGMVTEMALSTAPAWSTSDNTSDVSWKDKDPHMIADFANIGVTAAYGRTVGWQFVEGRDFAPGMATDSGTVVLNETAVKYMGLKHPVGQTIQYRDSARIVVGVIRDMVVGSPFQPVKQTVYYLKDARDFLNMRINPNKGAHEASDVIKRLCKTYEPGAPISFRPVDKIYANKFRDEERVGTLASFFAVLAIFISALGLFGMAAYMAEQRVSEIGVRKVLGASVVGLWALLSKEFVYLVGCSLVIAMPVAYYFMKDWLQHYTYRVGLSGWIFVLTGLGAILVALLTVSFQSIRAAVANPVKALRSE